MTGTTEWVVGSRFRIKPPWARYEFEGTITQLFWRELGTWAMFESDRGPGMLAPVHLAHAEKEGFGE